MKFRYTTSDMVCSQEIIIEVDGGCAGNTAGVSSLIKGMKIDEAIKRLKGIQCGNRGTSCPDQLAIALEKVKNKMS